MNERSYEKSARLDELDKKVLEVTKEMRVYRARMRANQKKAEAANRKCRSIENKVRHIEEVAARKAARREAVRCKNLDAHIRKSEMKLEAVSERLREYINLSADFINQADDFDSQRVRLQSHYGWAQHKL